MARKIETDNKRKIKPIINMSIEFKEAGYRE